MSRLRPVGLVLLGASVLAGLSALALRQSGLLEPQVRAWVFFLHVLTSLVGMGAFVVPAIESARFALRRGGPSDVFDPALPPEARGMRGRAVDPGRTLALTAFPLLTAAVLLGSAWSLIGFAAILWMAPAELWLVAAWLLAAAYLHATSGWRPLRVPGWVPVVLALLTLAAGIAAALSASSLFSA